MANNSATRRRTDAPLTRRQIRELERRIADHDNPVRYVLGSRIGLQFVSYYEITDDVYVWKNPAGATLFKRRKAAEAVRRLLGKRVRVLRCMTRLRNGERVVVLTSLPHRAGRKAKRRQKQ